MRLVAALALLLALAVVPAAAAQQRQTATAGFTTTEPGAAAGTAIDVQVRGADANAKPPTLQRLIIDYPEGTGLDFTVPQTCRASDADLEAQGEQACPPGSVVSRGRLDTDSGSPGGVPRHVENRLTTFNGDGSGELITLAESDNPQTRVVSRAYVQGRRVVIEFPALPGNPPPDPYLAYRRFALAGTPITKEGRAFVTTPTACPSGGAWVTGLTFVYRDGAEQKLAPRSACRRPGEPAFSGGAGVGGGTLQDDPPFEEPTEAAAPRVTMTGVPRRCVRRSFLVRVRITAQAPLRHAVVEVNGRRVALRRTRSFRVRVPVRRLERGRHLLEVVARDTSGDLGAATRRFRRC